MANFTADCYKGVTFGGDPELKAKMLGRAEGHRMMDHFMQGIYWQADDAKGCAIGCLATGAAAFNTSNSQHSGAVAIACEFQIPYWLARLAETAFEGSRPKMDAVAWVEKFVAAIPVGVELSEETVYEWVEELDVDNGNWGAHNEPMILDYLKGVTPDKDVEEVQALLNHVSGKADAESEFFKQFRKAREAERESIKEIG